MEHNFNKSDIVKIAKVFGPKLNSSYYELISLILKVKKALRLQLHKSNINDINKFARLFNLKSRVYETKKNNIQKYNPKKGMEEKNKILAHLAYSEETLDKLKHLEKRLHNHDSDISQLNDQVGEILGYPQCCREFFSKYSELATPKIIEKVILNSQNYNNILLDIIGAQNSYIPHIPCNFNCEKSAAYVEKILQELGSYPEFKKELAYIFFNEGGYIKMTGKHREGYFYYENLRLEFIQRYIENDENLKELFLYLQEGNSIDVNNFKIFNDDELIHESVLAKDSGYKLIVFGTEKE